MIKLLRICLAEKFLNLAFYIVPEGTDESKIIYPLIYEYYRTILNKTAK